MGEKLDQIEVFHPDRMASRILGMGDVLSLIEKAEQSFDQKKALELQEKLRKNKFTLTDFYDQMVQLKGMGSLSEIAGMLPGVKASDLEGADLDTRQFQRMEGHHHLHDPLRAGEPLGAQLQPEKAHRRRLGHPRWWT